MLRVRRLSQCFHGGKSLLSECRKAIHIEKQYICFLHSLLEDRGSDISEEAEVLIQQHVPTVWIDLHAIVLIIPFIACLSLLQDSNMQGLQHQWQLVADGEGSRGLKGYLMFCFWLKTALGPMHFFSTTVKKDLSDVEKNWCYSNKNWRHST